MTPRGRRRPLAPRQVLALEALQRASRGKGFMFAAELQRAIGSYATQTIVALVERGLVKAHDNTGTRDADGAPARPAYEHVSYELTAAGFAELADWHAARRRRRARAARRPA